MNKVQEMLQGKINEFMLNQTPENMMALFVAFHSSTQHSGLVWSQIEEVVNSSIKAPLFLRKLD